MVGLMAGSRGDELAEVGQAALVDTHVPTDDADAALAKRCRNGDVGAFRELVERHEKRVYALVARVLGSNASQDDIEDTVQDVFVQAWRALPRFRGDAKFSTWLYRVATNMAIKQWHRARRQRNVVSDEDLPESVRIGLSDPNPGPAAAAEVDARDRAVKAAIEALPEKQRTVILLHYFEGHPCEEVAQIMGCSVGTVWSRLHYACRKLRGTLDWLQQAPA